MARKMPVMETRYPQQQAFVLNMEESFMNVSVRFNVGIFCCDIVCCLMTEMTVFQIQSAL